MSMQVLEQKFISLSTLFLSFAILNKTKYTNQEIKCNLHWRGVGVGFAFGLTETCFPSLSSGQKHKPKIGSQ